MYSRNVMFDLSKVDYKFGDKEVLVYEELFLLDLIKRNGQNALKDMVVGADQQLEMPKIDTKDNQAFDTEDDAKLM